MPKRAKAMIQVKVGFPDSVREKIRELAQERDESEAMVIRELVKNSLAKTA